MVLTGIGGAGQGQIVSGQPPTAGYGRISRVGQTPPGATSWYAAGVIAVARRAACFESGGYPVTWTTEIARKWDSDTNRRCSGDGAGVAGGTLTWADLKANTGRAGLRLGLGRPPIALLEELVGLVEATHGFG